MLPFRIERHPLEQAPVGVCRGRQAREPVDPLPDRAGAGEPDVRPERVHRGVREEHLAGEVGHQDPVRRRVEHGPALSEEPLPLRLRHAPLADVEDRAEVALGVAPLVAEGDGAAGDPDDGLVGAPEAVLGRERDVVVHESVPGLLDMGPVVRMDRLEPTVAVRSLAREPGQLAPFRVHEDARARAVGREDADRRAADEGAREVGLPAQLALELLARAQVEGDAHEALLAPVAGEHRRHGERDRDAAAVLADVGPLPRLGKVAPGGPDEDLEAR